MGTINPTVTLYLTFLLANAPENIPISTINDRFQTDDFVFYDITWPNDEEIAIISTNRVQNESSLVRCNVLGSCQQEAEYREDKGWLDTAIPIYNKEGTQRIEILSQPQGDDFYNHLVLTDVAKQASTRLTEGEFTVTRIFGWDEDNGLMLVHFMKYC